MTTPTAPEYIPGEWVAVVTPGRVAFLPSTVPAATVQRLWASMQAADGASLVEHLQVLAAGDLTAMPPFALLTVDHARLHAVVRGTVEVVVTVAGRLRVLSAPHVSTWAEEVVEGAERVEVRASGQDKGERGDAAALPVAAGVVRAGAVRVPVGVAAAARADRVEPAIVPTPAQAGDVASGPVASGDAALADPALSEPLPARLLPAEPLTAELVPAELVLAEVGAAGEPIDITLLRPAQPEPSAAPEPAAAPVPEVSAAADVLADHDGTTVLGHEVLALRRQLPEWTGHAVVGPLVLPAPATPAPARIALSTGEVVSLSRPVLVGRAPQATRVPSSQVPRLVTVPSPLQDISRTHAEVRMDGDDVVLTDLRSTNGVLVVHPAGTPQRLQPGEATVLQPGVLVDLGEGVTFTVERGA